jgi:hypothetical protein
LGSRLAQGNHVFYQPEDIVQLRLFSYSHDDLEHLQCLILVKVVHEGEGLIQRPILSHEHVLVVLTETDKSSPFAKHPLEKIISVEVNDPIQQVRRGVADLEVAVLTVGREKLLLISCHFQFVLFGKDALQFVKPAALFEDVYLEGMREEDVGAVG